MKWIVIIILVAIALSIVARIRRKSAMHREVLKVLQTGTVLENTIGVPESGISYRAARKFALDSGAEAKTHTDLVTFDMFLNGSLYLVTVYESPNGSAGFFVEDKLSHEKRMRQERIERHRRMGFSEEQIQQLEDRLEN